MNLFARVAVPAAIALAGCAGQSERAAPAIDHVVPVWYAGLPVVMRSFELSSQGFMREEDIPARLPYTPSLTYIVGVVDLAIGASPHQRIVTPSGATITMPGHQTVLSCLASPDEPTLGIAYAVIPGPAARADNLRADAAPEHSLIGASLATHIRTGPSWIPLTSHAAIESGLHSGVLRLRFFGANPVSWATPVWEDNYPFVETLFPPCEERARAEREFVVESAGPIPEGQQPAPVARVMEAPATPLDPARPPLVFCVRCHGANGVSPNEIWPNLSGLSVAYMRRQMQAYASGARVDDMMKNWGARLDPATLEQVLAHFAAAPAAQRHNLSD